MSTESIETFIVGLRIAEKDRLIALDSIRDILFSLACFLAKIDRRHVRNIAVQGFVAPIPVDLSPSSLYEWRFLKIGTVRDGDLDFILLLGDELCLFILYQDESTYLVELFGSRATKASFNKYLLQGEKRFVEKSMASLSDVHHLRLQQIDTLMMIHRATPTQLGSLRNHKYDWPSRWLTKEKVGDIACKGTLGKK